MAKHHKKGSKTIHLTVWTTIWISLAMVFNYLFYLYAHWQFATNARYLSIAGFDPGEQAKTKALEFSTGFVIEKSLAIDNIFIFAVVFGYFAIPKIYQHRVLFWGIVGALVFRGIFIATGSVLMQYEGVVIFFGVLLIVTGVMDKFIYIKYGLASVLIFVGGKMVYLNETFGGKFSITWSLGIIAILTGSSIAISIFVDGRRRTAN
jgi:predicted tellurium resistance membrane protein TerC